MTNVIPFNGITKLDLNPDIVLENTKGKLEGLVICGYDKDEQGEHMTCKHRWEPGDNQDRPAYRCTRCGDWRFI